MARKFVVSDQSINSYGFRILTKGIKMDSFKKNPVMLFNHMRSDDWKTEYNGPIGRWENLKKEEDGTLTADPVFDENDPKGAMIASKVENGFLNAASIGIKILKTSEAEEDLLPGQYYPTVTQCELVEISVCDIPSNKNAIALYDGEGKVLNLNDAGDLAKLSDVLTPVKPQQTPLINPSQMKLKLLSAWTMLTAFLGAKFGENVTEIEFETTPEKLKELDDKLSELQNLQAEKQQLSAQLSVKDTEIAVLKAEKEKAETSLAEEKTAHEKLKETLGAQPTKPVAGNPNPGEKKVSWVDPNAEHNQLRAKVDSSLN